MRGDYVTNKDLSAQHASTLSPSLPFPALFRRVGPAARQSQGGEHTQCGNQRPNSPGGTLLHPCGAPPPCPCPCRSTAPAAGGSHTHITARVLGPGVHPGPCLRHGF
ncbi:hypothetical protein VFPFJ_02973 [Purpureocillium lilacinum]|uniref:Uncharacterized protein n=1 Tax=Purpureocillium lilacinum TaxID=33203 RepID=A0A179HWR2_PURLI|nr:hypothetical protein VFPFJ_02973 [Purpureocillium lilacinum]OAQ93810.1 hypothetical protein VFPFJ_02973 [Purpureocillium lilacinum]